MKKLVFLLSVLFYFSSKAQLRIAAPVYNGGNAGAVSLGTTDANDLTIKLNNSNRWVFDNVAGYLRRGSGSPYFGLQLYSTGVGATMTYGDVFDATTPYVGSREHGGTDTDQWEAFGQKGLYLVTGTYGSTARLNIQQDGDIIYGGETQVSGAEHTFIGDVDMGATLNVQGNLTAANILKGSAVLDFPSTNGGASSELTIAVAGAAVGDAVAPGIGTSNANSGYEYRISAANTLSVKFINSSAIAINPASATFKYVIIK